MNKIASHSLFGALLAGSLSLAAAQTAPNASSAPLSPTDGPAMNMKTEARAPLPDVSASKDISALVGAEEDATLSSQMAGRIKAIHYGIGQSFHAGATLLEFDCAEQQAKLQSAQAEFLGMRETHLTKLKLQGLGAAGELEVTMAAAAAEKAKAQVRQQEVETSFCKLKAPYAGRIAKLRAKAYENVALGQPLLDIVSNKKLKVTMNVPSSWTAWLKNGTPVKIRLAGESEELSARVSKINARVDSVSQLIEVEARFTGKTPRLLPGMIGAAQFPTRPQ